MTVATRLVLVCIDELFGVIRRIYVNVDTALPVHLSATVRSSVTTL
ncbi:MAG: hypothetical protein ACLP8S_20050 [Solirubrobacteraceae bacterium]